LPGSRQSFRFATSSWQDRDGDEPVSVPLLSVSGRLAAVASSSSSIERAQGFALWLASRPASQQTGPHSQATTLFRTSQVSLSQRWTGSLDADSGRQYGETLEATLSLPRAMPGLTLPGRGEYIAALDKAVHAALAGTPPREALSAAADEWRAITNQHGQATQRRANGRATGQGEF
jgi:hypothetical protein